MSDVLERFLRYVKIETTSKDGSATFPSTDCQLVLLNLLAEELKGMGIRDVTVDGHGYVMATIESNLPKGQKAPVLGLIAHVDTSPDVSGKDVEPILHSPYDGKDIALKEGIVISVSENSHLKDNVGKTIITSDGTTLLGADDKAGVASIMAAAKILVTDGSIKHGRIRIAFTPDEEVGNGTKFFDVKRFGAEIAYTIDGGELGEVEDETFNAMSATFKIKGLNYHPGYAKGKMVNATRIASEIVSLIPTHILPENTEGREGYLHPNHVSGSVEEATVKVLIRDFTMEGMGFKVNILENIAELQRAKYPEAEIELDVQESYRNMKYMLEKDTRAMDYAVEAVGRAGVPVKKAIVRGGTDGSRLSYMGLPTPNIFAGGMNFHSRKEFVPLESMEACVKTLIELVKVNAERAA